MNSLKFHWTGTAGCVFPYGKTTILLDPYLTRVSNRETAIKPNWNYIKHYIPHADYIVISHSHFDHLADAPVIARMTGARIIGSQTTINICRSMNVKESQLIEVGEYDKLEYKDFSVTFLPSLHGTNAEGRVPNEGLYTSPPSPSPRTANDFREGGTFAPYFDFEGIRVLQIGSANFMEEALKGKRVDVLLVCIAWRERVPRFTQRLIECVKPRVVVPIHHDNFWLPLEDGFVLREDTSLDDFRREMEGFPDIRTENLSFFEDYFLV